LLKVANQLGNIRLFGYNMLDKAKSPPLAFSELDKSAYTIPNIAEEIK